MSMTTEEEHAFIKKEVEWTKKQQEDKGGDLAIATKRYNEARFRAEITQKALDDFYEAHPEMKE